ncbi:MAG: hypothetical protein ACR2LL_01265 [Nitrosopumilus sp.]|uniref:hypothetical protein n=1 Tax=Nitrosopumilus sp. TaxID=2024843 RepID=UPI00292F1F6A|nr:hypothetical protein [Nitrosopumilus sp.]
MNQKTKTIGLFTILSLAMVAIAPSLVGDAQATRPSADADAIPLNTEQLQEQAVRPEPRPVSLELIQLEFTNGNTSVKEEYKASTAPTDDDGIKSYKVAYVVANQGDGKVRNIEVVFSSDSETVQATLSGELDGNNSVVSTSIKAIDPNSIDAAIGSFEIIN